MQTEIRNFSRDLKKEVNASKYKKEIVTIVLLGSAARGEFIKGESDIDFIVVVKSSKSKRTVTKFISRVLNKLNKRYDLRLEETCTDREKYKNEILTMITKLEALTFFGVPFYVISMEDYDFFRNKISSPRIWFLGTFLGSLNEFLISVKDTGKVIYGKNLLKLINVKLDFSDRIKVIMEQGLILFASVLIFPFNTKLSLKHAVKASLYQEEFDLLFLQKHLKGYVKDTKTFNAVFSDNKFFVNHLKKTIYYRKNYGRIRVSRAECAKFIGSTMRFIFGTMKAV
ncbi:MAG: nucleotidyltransferase domain-containing protein [Candidatus Aenigmatarchaeota archaeon]